MLERVVLYVVPLATLAAVAFTVTGPGREGSARGARARGALIPGESTIALRLACISRFQNAEEGAPKWALHASITGRGSAASWQGQANENGLAEAVFQRASGFGDGDILTVTVDGEVVAEGPLAFTAERPRFSPAPPLRGVASGPKELRIRVRAGILAAPFLDQAIIEAPWATRPIELSAVGAELSTARVLIAEGRATFGVTPTFSEASLTAVTETEAGEVVRLEAPLPLVPGAMRVDLIDAGPLVIRSAVPRSAAYLSWVTPAGRIGGHIVPLAPTADGFYEGRLERTALPLSAVPLGVVVAGDPAELGSGTAAWPLIPAEGLVEAPRLEMLLDGVKMSETREAARARSARLSSLWVIAGAALIELTLLARAARRATASLARLSAELAAAGAEGAAQKPLPIAALLLVTALMFAAMAAFVALR